MPNVDTLFELDRLARNEVRQYEKHRFAYDRIAGEAGKHSVGIVGPRGVGKTVLLKQLTSATPESVYISVDTLEDAGLFEVVRELSDRYSVRHFFLDEIHFQEGFEAQLKRIYDFLDARIVFTSSVALALRKSGYDLSRRARLHTLHPFSLREYIYFRHDELLPGLSVDDLVNGEIPPDMLRRGADFRQYLAGGNMPFALAEPNPIPLMRNIIDTIVVRDIPMVMRLEVREVDLLKKMVAFIARSGIDGINYSSISHNLGITKYKAEQYLRAMQDTFVLHLIFPEGTNVLKEPKVTMVLPYRMLENDREDCIGGLREDFVVDSLTAAGMPFHYLKSPRGRKRPDYMFRHNDERVVFEVGGKGKGYEQFKGVSADRKLVFADGAAVDGNRRPLLSLGFLD
ncbi:MAG: AAA family ATPase [Candidatus Pacebacteria bacterium]|nr:AAA family ATPase [Candidatus Paceibacterota bacterium]